MILTIFSFAIFVNGKFCKDPKLITVDDFIFMGLDVPRNTLNQFGSNVTLVNVDMFPGLNTLGIALARVVYAPYGLNSPHIHPRATELLTVIEGTLLVGFVTSNPDNRLVFPMGLIHFQFNIGETNSVAFSSLDSQNPGLDRKSVVRERVWRYV